MNGNWKSRDYFAEMYVAGVMADAGWNIYFPHRDQGFDLIATLATADGTIVRPVQIKGKYPTEGKTDKARYGYVGKLTAFHPDMVLAIPLFAGMGDPSPKHIAWMTRSEIRPMTKERWRCEPARFVGGCPEPRPGLSIFFDRPGLSRLAAQTGIEQFDGDLGTGAYPWPAPIGYRNHGAAKVKTPDPHTAPLVRLAFELYANGTQSIRSLQAELNLRGLRNATGKPLSKTGVEKLLGNTFYCGLIHIRRTGQTYNGAHEPIIGVGLFQRVQEIKSGKNVKKVTRHNHLFRGLFRCQHCSRSLIGELHKGRVYYRCQTKGCETKSVREDEIDRAIVTLLQGLSLSEADRKAALERLPAILTPAAAEDAMAGIDIQVAQVAHRLGRLTDMALDNLIEPEPYQAKKQALMLEQQRLAEMQADAEKNALDPGAVQRFLELATNLALLYQSAAKAQKRRIVEWATLNRLASGKSPCFEPSKWLLDTQTMLGVLCCAEQRDDSRTDAKAIRELIDNSIKITKPAPPPG